MRWQTVVAIPAVCLASVAALGLSIGLNSPTPRFAANHSAQTRSQTNHARGNHPASLSGSTVHYIPKVNSQGETYGSAAGDSPTQLPDLIEVSASNGAIGYITKAAFLGTTSQSGTSPTLQQVLNYPKNSAGNLAAPGRTVAVYTSNATTQIGTFTIGTPPASGSGG